MKKILGIIAALALFTVSAFAQGKSIVIYFSRTDENYSVGYIKEGNTAKLAKIIAAKTSSDIFEIVPEKPYPAEYRACTDVAKNERANNARPAYKGSIDLSAYDTIYVGYPIWWGDLPMVMYTFLEQHDLSGKIIAPFCTHEGSGMGATANVFTTLYKNATVKKGLSMRGSTAQNDAKGATASVETWLKSIGN